MKKKIMILPMIFILLLCSTAFAENQDVEVVIPEYDVYVNDEMIDIEHSQYPVLMYKDITYFPMTSDYLSGLGLKLSFSGETGLRINRLEEGGALEQKFLGALNGLGSGHIASTAPFSVKVNGDKIDNSEEEYPVLVYNDITYFPMTWRFAVEEFGWNIDWDDSAGLTISVRTNGVIEYKGDGRVYEGQIIENEPDGNGKMTWPSGNRYEGEFVDGKRNGKGIYLDDEGFTHNEIWRYGKLVSSEVDSNIPRVLIEKILKYNENPVEMTLVEIAAKAVSVVKISVLDSSNRLLATGSGIIVDSMGTVLTNYHVIKGGTKYFVQFEDNEEDRGYYSTTVIASSKDKDLALLGFRLTREVSTFAKSEESPRGSSIVAIGSPNGLLNTISEGIISGFRKNEDTTDIQITAPISKGSSGGGLFNMNGDLIGVTYASVASAQNMNFAIPVEEVFGLYNGEDGQKAINLYRLFNIYRDGENIIIFNMTRSDFENSVFKFVSTTCEGHNFNPDTFSKIEEEYKETAMLFIKKYDLTKFDMTIKFENYSKQLTYRNGEFTNRSW